MTTTFKKDDSCFKQINISDIHLLHSRVSTEKIIEGLNAVLPFNDKMRDVHRINLVGDVFDTVVEWEDNTVNTVSLWIIRVLRLCVEYDIQLRVLKGTPSHDGNQSSKFVYYNDLLEIGADLKYIDEVMMIKDERYGDITFYVPDRIRPRHIMVYEEYQEWLEKLGVDYCDYGMFHGFFEHQVPSMIDCHQSEWYKPTMRYYIACGHDHHMSVNGIVLVQGSFDRLSHGEENPKGYFETTSFKDNTYVANFIENKLATKQNTYLLDGLDEKELDELRDEILALPTHSFVSIKVESQDYIPWIKVIESLVDGRKIKFTIGKPNKKVKVELPQLQRAYVPTPLNQQTLPTILRERLSLEGVSETVIEHCLLLLDTL